MSDIKEQLLLLVDLQNIDLKIYNVQREMKKLQEEFEKRKNEFEPMLKSFEEKKQKLKEMEVENMKIQLDLKEKEQLLKDLQEKFYKVRSPKEIKAIDTEINNTKKAISELEDKGIKMMESIENLKKDIKEEEQIIQTENNSVNELKEKIEKMSKEAEEKIKELKAKRNEIIQNIPKEILEDYDYIASKKDGIAVVAIKQGVCTGCYMAIPPQMVYDVRIGKKIYHCQFCSRILFYSEWENK